MKGIGTVLLTNYKGLLDHCFGCLQNQYRIDPWWVCGYHRTGKYKRDTKQSNLGINSENKL